MFKFLSAIVATLSIAHLAAAQESPCGFDAACEIEGGAYHLMFPTDWDGKTALPALVFYHGHGSSGASVFKAGGLRRDFTESGYLIIAPNGVKRSGMNGYSWPARPQDDGQRDNVAFTLAIIEDVATRVPLATDQIFAAGFSAGGSMAWMMACYAGDHFAGFVSVAGALRRPIPDQTCPGGPVRLLQVHGFADNQVPLEGRGIGDWHQGDVFESFNLMRATNSCQSNPDLIVIEPEFRCRSWSSCESGALKMCIHDGGHGLPKGWSAMAREWLEAG